MGINREKRTGVCHALKKVPEGLEAETVQILGHNKTRLTWLKRTSSTKVKRQTNILGKPDLTEFDRVLARAAALIAARPVESQLSDCDISRIAAYHFASKLAEDHARIDDEEINRLLAEGVGPSEIAKRLGIGRASVYRLSRSAGMLALADGVRSPALRFFRGDLGASS